MMRRLLFCLLVRVSAGLAAIVLAAPTPAGAGDAETAIDRGAYLVRAAGCISCHTDRKGGGAPFAGGRPLKTPFGIFYSPNITPDRKTGIGAWSAEDVLMALRQGVRPDGSHYFPVFPYTTYTAMSERDARDIAAYLLSGKPVRHPNKPHDVMPPFGWRWTMAFWKILFFDEGAAADVADADPGLRRGAYLVRALAHCGECHTPRNLFGAVDRSQWLAGTVDGPEGELSPNITPHAATGIGAWSEGDIVDLLRTGLKPDYDDVQGAMQEAIEDGLKYLTDEDLRAIARYLKSVPPIDNKIAK